MERAKALLRADELSVTDVCLAVGFTSLGSFSAQFRRFVGMSPTAYRDLDHRELARIPGCLVKRHTRPTTTPSARPSSRAGLEKRLGRVSILASPTWKQ